MAKLGNRGGCISDLDARWPVGWNVRADVSHRRESSRDGKAKGGTTGCFKPLVDAWRIAAAREVNRASVRNQLVVPPKDIRHGRRNEIRELGGGSFDIPLRCLVRRAVECREQATQYLCQLTAFLGRHVGEERISFSVSAGEALLEQGTALIGEHQDSFPPIGLGPQAIKQVAGSHPFDKRADA